MAATPENLEGQKTAECTGSHEGGALALHIEPLKAPSSDHAPENSVRASQEDSGRHRAELTASVAAISPKAKTLVSGISHNTDVFNRLGTVLGKVKLIANVTANAVDVMVEVYIYSCSKPAS